MLSEIFDHVVSFKFAVNQNVQADFFLESDPGIDSFSNKFVVFFLADLMLSECGTLLLDFSRLREGPDCRRRKKRQIELLILNLFAHGKLRLAHEGFRLQISNFLMQLCIFQNARLFEQLSVLP